MLRYIDILTFPFIVLFIFCSNVFVNGQQNGFGISKNIEMSTSIGVGIIEGHKGISIDGEIVSQFGKFSLGIYYNMMSSLREENPLPSRSITTIDEI